MSLLHRIYGMVWGLIFFTNYSYAQKIIEADICVYGGTSGGVIAAYAAKLQGKSVILIEPGKHLGRRMAEQSFGGGDREGEAEGEAQAVSDLRSLCREEVACAKNHGHVEDQHRSGLPRQTSRLRVAQGGGQSSGKKIGGGDRRRATGSQSPPEIGGAPAARPGHPLFAGGLRTLLS